MALSDEQIEKVRLMLATSGWNDIVKPMLQRRGKLAMDSLRLPRSERVGLYKSRSADYVRGAIQEIEVMLSVFYNEVSVYDENRRLDELDRQASTTEA